MEGPQRTCPDCNVDLVPIKLLDATDRALGEGTYRVELTYAAHDAQGGFFGMSGIAPSGKVHGQICPECGRILLFGAPMI